MIRRILVLLGLLIFALGVVVPLLWMLMTAMKSNPEIFASPWAMPSTPHWENFARAWGEGGIQACFINSLIVTTTTLAILLPTGAMAAYVFARYPFRGSKGLFALFMGGMMFPIFLAIVPLFLLLNGIGNWLWWLGLNTRGGLIVVYVAYSLPFTVFVLTGFFQTQPRELLEAAQIDGCGHSAAFWRVMLPLAKPGLVVVGIFNAIGLWNEYPLALVIVSNDDLRTLPLGLAKMMMSRNYQSDWSALFAGLVIVMVPILLVYWVFRDRIHDTMVAGALKG